MYAIGILKTPSSRFVTSSAIAGNESLCASDSPARSATGESGATCISNEYLAAYGTKATQCSFWAMMRS